MPALPNRISKFWGYKLTKPYVKDVCVQTNAQGCMKYNKVSYNADDIIIGNSDNIVTIDDTKTPYFRGQIEGGGQTEIPLSFLVKIGENITFEEMNKLVKETKNKSPKVTQGSPNTPNITQGTPNTAPKSYKNIIMGVLAIGLVFGFLKWKKVI